jgi:hypothetical protein
MLSEQLKPVVHGAPIAGVGGLGGIAEAGGKGEHVPIWQLPPRQSMSVKQDSSDGEKDSSEEDVEDDDCVAVTQPASNPRSSSTVVRLMSGKPP